MLASDGSIFNPHFALTFQGYPHFFDQISANSDSFYSAILFLDKPVSIQPTLPRTKQRLLREQVKGEKHIKKRLMGIEKVRVALKSECIVRAKLATITR
jgi:hypothetical protein